MGSDRAAHAKATHQRAAARVAPARGPERHLLCAARRGRLAAPSQRSAAANDGVSVVLRVARQRPVRNAQSSPGHGGSGAGRARSVAERRRARQPVREDDRERWAARLRCGQEGEGAQAAGHGGHGWPWLDPRTQPADVQDREGAPFVLRLSRRSFPFIAKAFADMGFAGDGPASATSITIEIVRKPADQVGFAVHPRRWVVERFFAWISRNRRLWKDPEATLASARAFLYAASVMLLISHADWPACHE